MEIWVRFDLSRRSSSFVDNLTAARGDPEKLGDYHARISRLAL